MSQTFKVRLKRIGNLPSNLVISIVQHYDLAHGVSHGVTKCVFTYFGSSLRIFVGMPSLSSYIVR